MSQLFNRISEISVLVCLVAVTVQAAPIHDAARQGDLASLRTLVSADASLLDAADNQGQTPLHLAVIGSRGATVRYLLEAGAAPDPLNRAGQTPLFIALDRSRNGAARDLLAAGAEYRKIGSQAVCMAVRAGNRQVVVALVEQGAPVNATGPGGISPLAEAVGRNATDLAEFLLRHGGDPQTRLTGEVPIVCWAAATGHGRAVGLLVDAGADLAVKDPSGLSALELARRHGHPEIVALLEAAGAPSAPQAGARSTRQLLDLALEPGQAVLWHLGHCGWAIKTREHLLVFDYFPGRFEPAQPGLANGFLSAAELRDQNVWIFVTHGHRDHFDPAIYVLADQMQGVRYVYGFEPDRPYRGPGFTRLPPRTGRDFGELNVVTIEANDAGVGFLVTVDGVTIYHAGDHAGWRENERSGFTAEIDDLQRLGPAIDLAFLNVTGCHTHGQCPLEDGTQYTLERLQPAAWFPTHAGGHEYIYREYSEQARARGAAQPTACPNYAGDVFHYRHRALVVP